MIDLNAALNAAEFTDEQLRTSPYAVVMADAIVVGPDEYRSGPPSE